MPLALYAVRRALVAVPLLAAVAALTFLLIHLAPGDPVFVLAGEGGTPEHYAAVRRALGLDRPLLEQLARYLGRTARGDLGVSLQQGRPVAALIAARLPPTLLLGASALALSTLAGLLLGVAAARAAHGWLDRSLLAVTAVAASMPVFWTGLLLVAAFSLWLGWLPAQGMASARPGPSSWLDVARHLLLPAVALSLQPLASLSRVVRVKVLEGMREPYALTARAKGLPEGRVVAHVMRNALLPALTVIGGSASALVTGAVLTETVFAWPGLGRLALDAALARDYPVIVGAALVASAATVALNLLTDVLYAVADPRIAYA